MCPGDLPCLNFWSITQSKLFGSLIYDRRTPGSYIEEKQLYIVWHYDNADPAFGAWQAAECQNHIEQALRSLGVHAVKKRFAVEVSQVVVNKV